MAVRVLPADKSGQVLRAESERMVRLRRTVLNVWHDGRRSLCQGVGWRASIEHVSPALGACRPRGRCRVHLVAHLVHETLPVPTKGLLRACCSRACVGPRLAHPGAGDRRCFPSSNRCLWVLMAGGGEGSGMAGENVNRVIKGMQIHVRSSHKVRVAGK